MIFSKAARGRPEGPTEQSVFKFFFVMMAIFRVLLANLLEKKLVQRGHRLSRKMLWKWVRWRRGVFSEKSKCSENELDGATLYFWKYFQSYQNGVFVQNNTVRVLFQRKNVYFNSWLFCKTYGHQTAWPDPMANAEQDKCLHTTSKSSNLRRNQAYPMLNKTSADIFLQNKAIWR